MRIGPFVNRLVALLALAWAGASGDLVAQTGPESNYQRPQLNTSGTAASHPMQAMFYAPMGMGRANPYVDAHGNPVVVPAQYSADYADDGSGSYGYPPAGDCSEQYGYPPACDCSEQYGYPPACECGGQCAGCGRDGCRDRRFCNGQCVGNCCCRYGYGGSWQDPPLGTYPPFPDDVEDYSLLPPSRTEQCGPHYFDVRMEAIYMTRDETFEQQVDFTSDNVAGPIVLSSGQLDFEYETGFRILGRYDCGPLSVIEFGYWGLENLDADASFTDDMPVDQDTGNLYSLFTDFVRDPLDLPPDVTTPDGSLPWTERSITHSIQLESELHTGEFNYRRYWVGFSPTVSGTMLAGFRFTRLREDFRFEGLGEARGRYDEGIKNDMAGFQAGGDVWLHIRQGVRIGAEGKIGLMSNHYTLVNTFSTDPIAGDPPDFTERFEKDQPALIVDASADLVWDICPSWSIRGGYEMLFLNSILLAGENFNTGTVYNDIQGVTLPQRIPFVNDQGDAFYHGGHLGIEYVW